MKDRLKRRKKISFNYCTLRLVNFFDSCCCCIKNRNKWYNKHKGELNRYEIALKKLN